ncbi:MAG: CRTAC1 family protein [Candidatus Latescibacteria bacterium]|nr:CRTAC1 family protein [Candidatus Latescibacterota bacterium]
MGRLISTVILMTIAIPRVYAEETKSVSGPALFAEVAALAGVNDFGRGRASAFGDYDGDGDLDLVIGSQQKAMVLYRNDGSGRYTDVTAAAGVGRMTSAYGTVFGDYDNDGDLDLYVSRGGFNYERGRMVLSELPNVLFRNNGNGTFTNVTKAARVGDKGNGFGAAWGDYDNDGFLDLFVANNGQCICLGRGGAIKQTCVLYHNNGEGGSRPEGSRRADGEGWTFTNVTKTAGISETKTGIGCTWVDINNDGFLDIWVASLNGANALYRNNRDGTFTDIAAQVRVEGTRRGFAVAAGDYDNDGDMDLYVTSFNDWVNGTFRPGVPNLLYRNDGEKGFTDVTVLAGAGYIGGSMGTNFGDYDYDGDLDLYLGNGGPERGRAEADILYRNNGDGTFTDATDDAGVGDMGRGHGAIFGDYDGDGDLDIYVPMGGFFPDDSDFSNLFRNDGVINNWVIFKLVGTRSNRDGIGAKVAVKSGTLVQVAEVSGGSGFGSQNSLPVEFGLGKNLTVDEVTVRWPSGTIQTLKDLPVNRTLTITESKDASSSLLTR